MCIIGGSTSATVRIGVLRLLSLLAPANRHFPLSPSLSLCSKDQFPITLPFFIFDMGCNLSQFCGHMSVFLLVLPGSLLDLCFSACPRKPYFVAERGRAGQRLAEPRHNRQRLLLLLQMLLGGRETGNSTCCLGQWNSGHKLQTAPYLLGTPLWFCFCFSIEARTGQTS